MSHFEIYQSSDDWYWRLKANNGQIIATGGESFVSKDNAEESVQGVIEKVKPDTPIVSEDATEGKNITRFAYYQSENDKQYYWRLKANNNKIIAIGHEGFADKGNVIVSIKNVRDTIVAKPSIVFCSTA